MPYGPATLDTFGGLLLADDPQQVPLSNAVDAVNHDPSVRGQLRARPGSETFITLTAGQPVTNLLPWTIPGGGRYIVAAQSGFGIKVFDNTQAVVASDADITNSMVTVGQPGATRVYYAKPGAGIGRINTLLAFGDVTGAPNATLLTVTPSDNRLVAAENSRVSFSDEGDPETFGANNFVELDPGDGEDIVEMATWNDRLFVFKRTKFYVFYGTSITGAGTPIFNYRPVKNTVGVPEITDAGRLVALGAGGVYMLARDGIYRTTGDTPVKVSEPIDAWFSDRVSALATEIPSTSATRLGLTADAERLYFCTSEGAFVMDFDTGQWSAWTFDDPIRAVTVATLDGITFPTFVATENVIRTLAPGSTADDADDIEFSYRTGVSDLDVPEVKVVRQLHAWGCGSPALSVYADHATTDTGASPVTLGAFPAVEDGLQLHSRQGTFFSIGIDGTGDDTLNRVAMHVRDRRATGVGV